MERLAHVRFEDRIPLIARSLFWSAFMLLLIVVFMEESFVPVLLKRKAAHIRFTEKRASTCARLLSDHPRLGCAIQAGRGASGRRRPASTSVPTCCRASSASKTS